MASQRFAFPLPERALPRIRISPEQHEELRAFAVRTALDVLREGPTWGRSNVQAARERGWKVSQRSPDVCFMMKTTTTSKPVKPVKTSGSTTSVSGHANGSARSLYSGNAPSSTHSISSDESPLTGGATVTPGGRARGSGGGSGGRAFMGAVRLAGYNLDDVVTSIHCETTRAQRQQLTKSYGPAYLDCCILQTLEGAKPFDPFWYLGLKWTALKTPFEKLVNHREFVYLEHSGTHVNAQGQRMLYRIIQSVSLDEFGGESAYFGLTRAHLEAAYVYWMDGPSGQLPPQGRDAGGVLTVCMKGLAHPKGKVPLWLVERYMKKFWKAGWSLKGSDGAAVSAMALDDPHQITLDLATEWVADADRKACALCQKKFRFGRRMRHHCRACGEVICRTCTQYFLLTYPTSSSVGAYPFHHQYSGDAASSRSKASLKTPFGGSLDDDDDDLPATLGGDYGLDSSARRGRMRVASENDAVMVGKVCRRCVEMKKVAIRKDPSRVSSIKQKSRASHRTTRALSWEHPANGMGGGRKPQPIHEGDDEHDEHELPIMGHDDESDAEFFVPETPGPNMHQHQYYHNHHQQQHYTHHDDDTASEFSIGDFESSNVFKPHATIDVSAAGHHAIDEDKTGTSLDSHFSQSGFSVAFHAHDDDDSDDDDDGIVDYHTERASQAHGNGNVRHPQLGHLTHLTEEERFTSTSMQRPTQTQTQTQTHNARPLPPPPVAQNFVLTAAALNADRYKQDARLRLEDLLADTDDEGEQDYSTSPPMRPSALEIQEMRPQPQLLRTISAPPLTTTRDRTAPPPPPPLSGGAPVEDSLAALHLGRYHVSANRDHNRESNVSSVSFSSFDADMLIDASAFEYDDPRMSTTFDEGEHEDDDVLYARIQNIQDEVLRRQLLSSSASSVASSLSDSIGPAPIRFNRPARAPSTGFATAMATTNATSLSEASTISSNESFGSVPTDASLRESTQPSTYKKVHNAAQLQVESAIADQAQLLYRIQQERERSTAAASSGAGVRLY